jgi:hypothetical protein
MSLAEAWQASPEQEARNNEDNRPGYDQFH